MNHWSSSWMYYGSIIKALSVSLIHYWFIICNANSLWIHDLFHEFTIDLFCYEFTMFYQTTRFDPIGRVWPKFDLWILEKILSPNICILDTFRLPSPIWPKFDLWWPFIGHDRESLGPLIRKNVDFRPKNSRSRCFNKIFKAYICILVQGWGTGPNKCWGVFSGLFDNTLVHY